MSEYTSSFYFSLGNYSKIYNSTVFDTLGLITYFSHSLSYVPKDDEIYLLVLKNILYSLDILDFGINEVLNNSNSKTLLLSKFYPFIIGSVWFLLLIVFAPYMFFVIYNMKNEMQYLFSLYFSIPRSLLSKLIDHQNPKHEKPSVSRLMTSSFAHHTKVLAVEDENIENEKSPINIADNFKVLVNDSDARNSVLPPNFVFKTSFVFIILTGITVILASISFFYIVNKSVEFNKYLQTIDIISQRTVYASLLMHGLSNSDCVFGNKFISDSISILVHLHSSLLFSTGNYDLSQDIISSTEFQKLHFENKCLNISNNSCKSLILLFDTFLNSISNTTLSLYQNNSNYSIYLRQFLNNDLFPLLKEVHIKMNDFSYNNIENSKSNCITILVLGIIFLILVFLIGGLPLLSELNIAAGSVKLPLKYLDPIELPELPLLIQYLQGECDYGDTKLNDQKATNQSGTSFLNTMQFPFAVFESDFTLLFANNSFYNLLGTSREATVGLPFFDVFSSVINFKNDDSHPFYSLIDRMKQLQRGVTETKFFEILTDLSVPGKSSFPIMIRLIYISTDNDSNNESLEFRNHYLIFINDLSGQKILEEKLKYESDISTKLKDSSISRPLISMLKGNDEYISKSFEKRPLALITIKSNNTEEEIDDDMLLSCSFFLRNSSDFNHTYSSVTKLIHKPPMWIYAGGLSQNDDDLKFSTSELIQFVLSLIDTFQQSYNHQSILLSAIIHIGPFSIIPIPLELSTIELIGEGYKKIKEFEKFLLMGKVIASKETYEIVKNSSDFIFRYIEKEENYEFYEIQQSVEINNDF